MESTKYSVATESGITNQEALVKKTLPSPKQRKRFLVPGGKNMFNPVDTPDELGGPGTIHTKQDLVEAIYTWLRHTRFFNEVKVSFAGTTAGMKTKTVKALDFDPTADGSPIWQVHPSRKHYLAEKIAEVYLNNPNVVAIEVTKGEIAVVTDTEGKFDRKSENFSPYVEFLPNYKAKGEYAIYRS